MEIEIAYDLTVFVSNIHLNVKKKIQISFTFLLHFIESQGLNPGLQSIWEDEKQRRRFNHESSMIEIPSTERK